MLDNSCWMPSPRNRIGYLPRKEVEKIIDDLAKEENLSKSKIVGVLVEEGLAVRGIFNNKTTSTINSKSSFSQSQNPLRRNDFFGNKEKEELISDSGSSTKVESFKSESLDASAYIEEEDLAMLAKIKNLKSLGLL